MTNNKKIYSQIYRPEIDGLRALAVIAVIINHFNKEILPSGYLGVDIFFVISGFIITSSIFYRPTQNFKDFILGFYERRIKRLVPALSVFVFITGTLICMFSQSPGDSLKTGIASLFGFSNIYLFQKSTNYFSSFTEFNSFTHTWSLGVEEQFYLLFPFLIWFTGYGSKNKNCIRNLFISITIFTLPSFIGFIYFYSSNQSAAYFLMPFRFWEMASGCLLFLGYQKRSSLFLFFEKFSPMLITAIIIVIMFLPNLNSGLSTFLIVLVTLILISSLKKGKKGYKYFTNTNVIFIGKLSYSLYLWHWAILAISRWTVGVFWWTVPIQFLLIFGFSIISYKYIETPLRKAKWFRFKSANIFFSGGVLAFLSAFLYLNGRPFKGFLYIGEDPIGTIPQYNQCHLPELKQDIKLFKEIPQECGSLIFKNSPTIYGVGDSHIEQFGYGISEIASKNNYNYALLWESTCFFPSSIHPFKVSNCLRNQSELQNQLIKRISPGDIVIVGNYLHKLINNKETSELIYYDKENNKVSKRKAVEIYKKNFIEFSHKITKKGAKVIFYIDSLIFTSLDLPGAACTEEWFRKPYNIPKECKTSLSSHIKLFNEFFKWREDWKDDKTNYVLDAYLYNENCRDDICLASNYNDSNHLNAQFAKRLIVKFFNEHPSLFKKF